MEINSDIINARPYNLLPILTVNERMKEKFHKILLKKYTIN